MSIDFDTALNTYFSLKSKYKDKYNSKKSVILNNPSLDKKKRRKQLRSIKMPCVVCKRPVGTIFQDKERKYIAVCGDRSNPCKLHIELQKSSTNDLERMIEVSKQNIEDDKFNIIKSKLVLLFGFIDEDNLIGIYEGLQKSYQENSKEYTLLLSEYQKNLNMEERKKNITELNLENYQAIKEIKSIMSEYLATDNVSLLKDAVDKYLDVIVENNDKLRENRYHMSVIEPAYEANTGLERELIQKIKTIQDNEIEIKSPEVISFVI
jgi:hypothetical protein